MEMIIEDIAKTLLTCAVIDCYPREAVGWLLGYEQGEVVVIVSALPIIRTNKRTDSECIASTTWELTRELLEPMAVGGFHSHPDDSAYMSDADKIDPCSGPYELVIPVTWKNERFSYPYSRWRAYHENDDKWRRMEIGFVGNR